MITQFKQIEVNVNMKEKLGKLHILLLDPIRSRFQTSVRDVILFDTLAKKNEMNIDPHRKLHEKTIIV